MVIRRPSGVRDPSTRLPIWKICWKVEAGYQHPGRFPSSLLTCNQIIATNLAMCKNSTIRPSLRHSRGQLGETKEGKDKEKNFSQSSFFFFPLIHTSWVHLEEEWAHSNFVPWREKRKRERQRDEWWDGSAIWQFGWYSRRGSLIGTLESPLHLTDSQDQSKDPDCTYLWSGIASGHCLCAVHALPKYVTWRSLANLLCNNLTLDVKFVTLLCILSGVNFDCFESIFPFIHWFSILFIHFFFVFVFLVFVDSKMFSQRDPARGLSHWESPAGS